MQDSVSRTSTSEVSLMSELQECLSHELVQLVLFQSNFVNTQHVGCVISHYEGILGQCVMIVSY